MATADSPGLGRGVIDCRIGMRPWVLKNFRKTLGGFQCALTPHGWSAESASLPTCHKNTKITELRRWQNQPFLYPDRHLQRQINHAHDTNLQAARFVHDMLIGV